MDLTKLQTSKLASLSLVVTIRLGVDFSCLPQAFNSIWFQTTVTAVVPLAYKSSLETQYHPCTQLLDLRPIILGQDLMLIAHCTSGNLTAMSPDCVIYRTHGSDGYCNWMKVRPQLAEEIEASNAYLWLDNLQIPDLNTARGEIGNFELDANWSLCLAFAPYSAHASTKSTSHTSTMLVVAFDAGQAKLGSHKELLTTTELLDFPDYSRLLGCVVDRSDVRPEARGIRVFWDRYRYFDIVGS